MSWSYSGNPKKNAKDAVRFLIGDTDNKDQLLLDEEIEYCLSIYNNAPNNAAIRCCETIVAKFSRLANEKVGQVSIDFKDKAEGYRALLRDLRSRLAMEDAVPYSGGISVSDKLTQVQNNDRVRPDFTKHMMENNQIAPWVTQNEHELFLNFED